MIYTLRVHPEFIHEYSDVDKSEIIARSDSEYIFLFNRLYNIDPYSLGKILIRNEEYDKNKFVRDYVRRWKRSRGSFYKNRLNKALRRRSKLCLLGHRTRFPTTLYSEVSAKGA